MSSIEKALKTGAQAVGKFIKSQQVQPKPGFTYMRGKQVPMPKVTTSPSKAFDSAIAGINDFMTSPKKKAALTYDRGPSTHPVKPAQGDYPYEPTKMPKGTKFGTGGD